MSAGEKTERVVTGAPRPGRRRVLAALAPVVVLPFAMSPGRAQTKRGPAVVGILGYTSPQVGAPTLDVLKRRLRELGWIENQNIAFEARWALGRTDRFEELAKDLMSSKPDVVWTLGTTMALAVKRASASTPIPIVVAASSDPVGAGLVQSLGRPGRNVTGLSSYAEDLGPKRVELLLAAIPGATSVGVLWVPQQVSEANYARSVKQALQAAGMQVISAEVSAADSIDEAFSILTRARADAVVVSGGVGIYEGYGHLDELLSRNRLPAIGSSPDDGSSAMLMRYGIEYKEAVRTSAEYIDRILRGAKPADLPMQQPNHVKLVINRRVAKSLGITLAPSLLLRADEVID